MAVSPERALACMRALPGIWVTAAPLARPSVAAAGMS
jgi:hypothetical protein